MASQLGLWSNNNRPPCLECGALSIHDHHVVPRSRGGTATVPLCEACHGKAHGRSMKISQLTRDALCAKQSRGERTGSVRYGYQLASDGIHLEPNPAEAAIIAVARQLRAEGLSYGKIAATLATQGFVSRNGRPFVETQVARMVAR